jgi:hypothetical protein
MRVVSAALSLVVVLSLPPGAAAAQSAARPVGTAVLDGVVRDSVGSPLEGAIVTIEVLGATVISGAGGHFRVDSLPSDTIDVSVRRVGFAPAYFAVAIPQGTRVSVAVKMLPNLVKLGTIVIEGETRDLRLQREGFYDRKRLGRGVLLGPEFMTPRRGLAATTVVREVPRMGVVCPGNGMRGCIPIARSGMGGCAPNVFVDGTFIQQARQDFDAIVDTRYVVGIEVYRSLLEAPPQYRRIDSNCGSIVVWTESAPPGRAPRRAAARDRR